jgi:hypothetical protein
MQMKAVENPVRMSGSHLCIPRNETVISKTELYCSVFQFLHSYICERFKYFQDRSGYSAAEKYVDRSWEYINPSHPHHIDKKDMHSLEYLASLIAGFLVGFGNIPFLRGVGGGGVNIKNPSSQRSYHKSVSLILSSPTRFHHISLP